ncbi:MAG: phospholipase D family protein [Pseudooceanicola sp.]
MTALKLTEAETAEPAGDAAGAERMRIRSLITAAEMFPALEHLALTAQRELLLSFRVFDPRTALRSEASRERGFETWADLLTDTAERGVKLRILLADFDPIFAADLHRAAWESARIFGARLPDSAEVLCALHECRSAPIWKGVFGVHARTRLEDLRKLPDENLTRMQQRALRGEWDLRPVTLHQKFAVADGTRAIIGGLDVDERRWDDKDHDQKPDETWHDVSTEVQGPVVGELRAHFVDCWRRALRDEVPRFSQDATPVEPAETRPDRAAGAPSILRTVSCQGSRPLQLGARNEVREHETAHIDAFAQAERSIYVETQFFRHAPLARALAAAAKRAPELEFVLLLPTEPERVIFDGHRGFDSRHAQALQIRCLDICKRAFGDRMTVVSPVQPRPAAATDPLPMEGARIVYVHSKVTVVDDHTAIVGSANMNGRSMRWDTEASLMFHDPENVNALRDRLARTWLDDRYGNGDPCRAATWAAAAEANAAIAPQERKGFVMPYPETRNRRFARFIPILPPEMF